MSRVRKACVAIAATALATGGLVGVVTAVTAAPDRPTPVTVCVGRGGTVTALRDGGACPPGQQAVALARYGDVASLWESLWGTGGLAAQVQALESRVSGADGLLRQAGLITLAGVVAGVESDGFTLEVTGEGLEPSSVIVVQAIGPDGSRSSVGDVPVGVDGTAAATLRLDGCITPGDPSVPDVQAVELGGTDALGFAVSALTAAPQCGDVQGVDADGDGHFSIASGGDDHCDDGTERSLGCSPETAPSMHPGAQEVCGNGIDENGDGVDALC